LDRLNDDEFTITINSLASSLLYCVYTIKQTLNKRANVFKMHVLIA